MKTEARKYTKLEEVLSSSTHGVGILMGFVACVLLVTFASLYRDVWSIVACSIFSASIVFLYTASTLYHAITSDRAKKILKKLDHIAIYYLIAGSYTPYLLVNIRGWMGWTLFGIIWGLAILGTVLKLCTSGSGTKLWSILLYLGMGWISIFMIRSLLDLLPLSGFIFLILGGLFYTGGVVFYVMKKKLYTHAIWHVFVLLGTLMHFFSIMFSCAL